MANYVLEVLDGDRAGEVLPVVERTLRIGRKAGNDLVLPDEKTSGVHCEIAPEGDRLVLKDLGSTNGTFLDGKRVTEIVLTPGDIVTIGRTKVTFRNADEAAATVDAGEFAVHTLDAGRVKRRGGSVGLLLGLLVVLAAAAGGWFWFQGQQQAGGQQAGARKQLEPLVVGGNKLDPAIASCEATDGWDLRAAGLAFQPTSSANTGTGALTAMRSVDDADSANRDVDFAVLQLAQPVPVFAGRSLTISAHVRTVAGARMAVRGRLFAESELVPFRFTSGTAMNAYEDGWQRVETVVAVPTGCDRLVVEIVAVLPDADAEAMVDDVAVVDGGNGQAIELRLAESGQTAFGFGTALAVRSTDTDNPATLLAIEPDVVPADLRQLQAAGWCALSDLGATLTCTPSEKSFVLAAAGVDSLQLVVPQDAASALQIANADARYASAAAESEFVAQAVLLGSGATRALVRCAEPTAMRGEVAAGLYRLAASTASVELVLGFRAERLQADELLRRALAARSDGQPGSALEHLTELIGTVPMYSETLAQAQTLRSELLLEQADHLQRLQNDFAEADFFRTRGGYERIVSAVDDLVQIYGEANFEDLATARQLSTDARQRLAEIDAEQQLKQRERLTTLADAFAATKAEGLQQAVQAYIDRYLPAATDPPSGGGGGGDGGKD